MDQCGVLIRGYIDDLKHHLITAHKIVTSVQAEFPIKCSVCGSMYAYFSSFRLHVLKNHPLSDFEFEVNGSATPDLFAEQIEEKPFCGNKIKNPHFFKDPVSLKHTTTSVADLITDLRCDVSLPEKKLNIFMDGYTSMSNWVQQYTLSKVKSHLASKNLLDDEDSIRLINELEIPDLTSDVRTPEDNFSYLCAKAGRAIPEPTEIILGKYKQRIRFRQSCLYLK